MSLAQHIEDNPTSTVKIDNALYRLRGGLEPEITCKVCGRT